MKTISAVPTRVSSSRSAWLVDTSSSTSRRANICKLICGNSTDCDIVKVLTSHLEGFHKQFNQNQTIGPVLKETASVFWSKLTVSLFCFLRATTSRDLAQALTYAGRLVFEHKSFNVIDVLCVWLYWCCYALSSLIHRSKHILCPLKRQRPRKAPSKFLS